LNRGEAIPSSLARITYNGIAASGSSPPRKDVVSMRKIVVTFILSYLRFFARLQLKKVNPIIVGVGGSSGKSSVCELIGIVLSSKYRVKQGKGKNSETGLPLDILGISMTSYAAVDWLKALVLAPIRVVTNNEKYDVYIAEMGIDSPVEPKNMRYLLKIIQPAIAVTTNISLEHSQYFDSFITEENEEKRKQKILEMTAAQETLLLTSLPKTGTAIVNLDDSSITNAKRNIVAKQITVSTQHKQADVYINKVQIFIDNFLVTFTYAKKEYSLKINALLPEHFVYSFMYAIAVGLSLSIDIEQTISSLEKQFNLPPGRSSVFKGINNTTIIDSSYNNATLPPILDMLELLQHVAKKQRKVAIIGDMRELGSMSKLNHEIVAEKILETADMAILIGPLMKQYAAPILRNKKFNFQSYVTFTDAKEKILESIKENDLILVKSSQNTLYLERVVEMLLADKKDVDKLCRRGTFWDAQRRKTP